LNFDFLISLSFIMIFQILNFISSCEGHPKVSMPSIGGQDVNSKIENDLEFIANLQQSSIFHDKLFGF